MFTLNSHYTFVRREEQHRKKHCFTLNQKEKLKSERVLSGKDFLRKILTSKMLTTG